MKKYFLCLLSFLAISFSSKSQTQTLHDFSAVTILGDTLDLSTLYGKKVLIVNTASFCGFTYEYGLLQDLYDLYGGEKFQILGFPSDDFNQEPGDDSTIYDFCLNIYGITFQMMAKTSVKGNEISPVYSWLTNASENGVADAPVLWNFQKYAIDEEGHWVKWYPTSMSPLDTSIVNWILSPSVIETFIPVQQELQNQINVWQGDHMTLEYNSIKAGEAEFIFSNILGRKILVQPLSVIQGKNRFEFETPSPGVYFATVITEGKIISQKIAVSR